MPVRVRDYLARMRKKVETAVIRLDVAIGQARVIVESEPDVRPEKEDDAQAWLAAGWRVVAVAVDEDDRLVMALELDLDE